MSGPIHPPQVAAVDHEARGRIEELELWANGQPLKGKVGAAQLLDKLSANADHTASLLENVVQKLTDIENAGARRLQKGINTFADKLVAALAGAVATGLAGWVILSLQK